MKKIIKLTESDLHRIVKESVQRILEVGVPDPSDFLMYEPGNQLPDEFDDEETWLDKSKAWREDHLSNFDKE